MNTNDFNRVIRELNDAAASIVPDVVDDAVTEAYRFGLSSEFVPALIQLRGLEWHTRHEDIVSALQQLRDPQSVDILEVTARKTFDYLDYDEFRGLARKCTWALADIGTMSARIALERLAADRDPLIAGYAQKRLDHWQDEIHRKKCEQAAGENAPRPTA